MKQHQRLQQLLCVATMAAITQVGCSSIKDHISPDRSTTVGASGQPIDADGWSCPKNTFGSEMVLIPMADGDRYCIDSNVATYGEYRRFVEEKGKDFSNQPPECSENKDYMPTVEYPIVGSIPFPPCGPPLDKADPDRALDCIDFCDASAFCAWAGKRLCGVRGSEPGKVMVIDKENRDAETTNRVTAELRQSVKNEWYNACSQGGTTKHPYGDTRQLGTCIDTKAIETLGDRAFLVGDTSNSQCHGTHHPYSRLFNMTGKIEQWINVCFGNLGCASHGGNMGDLSCAETFGIMSALYDTAGVRCCADAVPGEASKR